jgi:signal transduction histidine kinase
MLRTHLRQRECAAIIPRRMRRSWDFCSARGIEFKMHAGGSMSALVSLIRQKRETIAQRFAEHLYATSASPALPREEVIDSLREFLDELTARLSVPQCGDVGAPTSPSAWSHGGQRFSLGYDVGALIREYGTLHDLLYDVIEGAHIAVAPAELRQLSRFLVDGIAASAARYAHDRDEELQKQAAEHLAFLAHELRNPLGSMSMAFDRLQQGVLPSDNRSSGVLARGLRKLDGLINDALVQTKLRQGVQARPARVALLELVEELIEESSAEASEKGIRVVLDVRAEVASADPKLLYSALSNLVRNAVKFTCQGGTVQIRVRSAERRVIFEVEDQCGGLPEGTVHKLFDPYVQVGADRSGFGLGLAIAKQAVDAHAGSLRVHDLPGRGCVFVLEIPFAATSADSSGS